MIRPVIVVSFNVSAEAAVVESQAMELSAMGGSFEFLAMDGGSMAVVVLTGENPAKLNDTAIWDDRIILDTACA